MEIHTQALDDQLIPGLTFKISPTGSSYVTERRNTTLFCSGNEFSPHGVKVVRLNLNGSDAWLDPSTIKMQLVNTSPKATNMLKPLGGGHLFFRRARCMVASALVEDIDEWGRFSQMMSMMQARAQREHDFVEGFGGEKCEENTDIEEILGGGATIVCFTPDIGLLTQYS